MPNKNTLLDQQLDTYSASAAGRLAQESPRSRVAKWSSYATAGAAAAATAHVADAAIVHTTPTTPMRISIPASNSSSFQSMSLDIDGDGNNDLRFNLDATVTGSFPYSSYNGQGAGISGYYFQSTVRRRASVQPSNGQVLGTGYNFNVRDLSAGSIISSGQTQTGNNLFSSSRVYQNTGFPYARGLTPISSTGSFYSQSGGARTGMLGARFDIPGGSPHHAWVEITLEFATGDGKLVALKVNQWAYQTVPNAPIAAGAVPEPSSLGLGCLALGAAGVAALRRRKRAATKRQSVA